MKQNSCPESTELKMDKIALKIDGILVRLQVKCSQKIKEAIANKSQEKCKTCYNEDCDYMLTKLECDRCGNIMKDKQYNVVKHDFYWKTNEWYCMKCIFDSLHGEERKRMVVKFLSESFSLLGNVKKNIIIL